MIYALEFVFDRIDRLPHEEKARMLKNVYMLVFGSTNPTGEPVIDTGIQYGGNWPMANLAETLKWELLGGR